MDTNGYTWTSDDVQLVEKFIEIKNKGLYADGTQLTTVYNRVLGKNVPTTNCGSCMRARISELETALNSFKKALEVKEEENKESTEPKRGGRPRKKE